MPTPVRNFLVRWLFVGTALALLSSCLPEEPQRRSATATGAPRSHPLYPRAAEQLSSYESIEVRLELTHYTEVLNPEGKPTGVVYDLERNREVSDRVIGEVGRVLQSRGYTVASSEVSGSGLTRTNRSPVPIRALAADRSKPVEFLPQKPCPFAVHERYSGSALEDVMTTVFRAVAMPVKNQRGMPNQSIPAVARTNPQHPRSLQLFVVAISRDQFSKESVGTKLARGIFTLGLSALESNDPRSFMLCRTVFADPASGEVIYEDFGVYANPEPAQALTDETLRRALNQAFEFLPWRLHQPASKNPAPAGGGSHAPSAPVG